MAVSDVLGFYPCFRGTRSRTPGEHVQPGAADQFQSLFSWNSLSDDQPDCDPSMSSAFQSLFSWNSLSDKVKSEEKTQTVKVSILVFVELALGLYGGTHEGGPIVFQSLFSWNSLSDIVDIIRLTVSG